MTIPQKKEKKVNANLGTILIPEIITHYEKISIRNRNLKTVFGVVMEAQSYL